MMGGWLGLEGEGGDDKGEVAGRGVDLVLVLARGDASSSSSAPRMGREWRCWGDADGELEAAAQTCGLLHVLVSPQLHHHHQHQPLHHHHQLHTTNSPVSCLLLIRCSSSRSLTDSDSHAGPSMLKEEGGRRL